MEVDFYLLEAGVMMICESQGGDAKYHLGEDLKPLAEGGETLVVTVEVHWMLVV